MICPHCNVAIRLSVGTQGLGPDPDSANWFFHYGKCPACDHWILKVQTAGGPLPAGEVIVWPTHSVRPIATEVPDLYRSDFREACAVLSISAKASAALSRRILQQILVNEGKSTKKDLAEQIDELLPKLPGALQALHAIRQVGNFAAHPLKDRQSGTIVEVEPGEAEWLLDMLEQVFDHYFVQPAITRKNLAALNEKLKAAGKPEIQLPT